LSLKPDFTSIMLTYLLLSEPPLRKMEMKKPVNYGRSCQSCKMYFVTTDPSAYTCPWCSKAQRQGDLLEIDTGGDTISGTREPTQGEWR